MPKNDNKYVNPRVDAPRVKMADPIGDKIADGAWGTRIAPRKYKTYDAHLVSSIHLTAEDVASFRPSDKSTASIMAITKGVYLRAPHLMTAPTSVKAVEVMLQVSPAAQAIGKERLLRLMHEAPLGKILRSVSTMVNHDRDIEEAHKEAWDAWHAVARGPAPGQIDLSSDRVRLNNWTRTAAQALRCVEKANETRLEIDQRLSSRIPELRLMDTRGRKPLVVTDETIQQVGTLT